MRSKPYGEYCYSSKPHSFINSWTIRALCALKLCKNKVLGAKLWDFFSLEVANWAHAIIIRHHNSFWHILDQKNPLRIPKECGFYFCRKRLCLNFLMRWKTYEPIAWILLPLEDLRGVPNINLHLQFIGKYL